MQGALTSAPLRTLQAPAKRARRDASPTDKPAASSGGSAEERGAGSGSADEDAGSDDDEEEEGSSEDEDEDDSGGSGDEEGEENAGSDGEQEEEEEADAEEEIDPEAAAAAAARAVELGAAGLASAPLKGLARMGDTARWEARIAVRSPSLRCLAPSPPGTQCACRLLTSRERWSSALRAALLRARARRLASIHLASRAGRQG